MTVPRPPALVAMLLAPAAVDAAFVAGTIALAGAVGREPNLETAFVLVPIPMARVLLGLADSYGLAGTARTLSVLAGVIASLCWWVVGLVAAAGVARLAG